MNQQPLTVSDIVPYFAEFDPTQKQLKKLLRLLKSVQKSWDYGRNAIEEATLIVAPGELSRLTIGAYQLLKRCQSRVWALKRRYEEQYGYPNKGKYGDLFNLLLSIGLIADVTPRDKLKGSMTVRDLKALLKDYELPTKGKKDQLVDRVVANLSKTELEALVADVILFRTTEAGDQAIQTLRGVHSRMLTAFPSARFGTSTYFQAEKESPPTLPPGVLYDDGEVRITEADVDRAIAFWDEAMPEYKGMLEAGAEEKIELSQEDPSAKIAEFLRLIQEKGREGNFVHFVVDAQKNYYIQFTAECGKTSLYAEAVSNEYLKPEFALTTEQIAHLRSMGWNAPGPNFYQEREAITDEDRLQIAQEVIRALVEVDGWVPGQPVAIELWLG